MLLRRLPWLWWIGKPWLLGKPWLRRVRRLGLRRVGCVSCNGKQVNRILSESKTIVLFCKDCYRTRIHYRF